MRSLGPIAVLAGVLCVAACEGPPGPAGHVKKIGVDDDTYVNESDLDDDNEHVGDPALRLSATPGSSSRGYVKYELVGFSDVISAHFRFQAKVTSSLQPVVIVIEGTDDDAWDGNSMNWNGQPPPTGTLGTFAVDSLIESLHDLDVTGYLSEQINKGPVPTEDRIEATLIFSLETSAGTAVVLSSEDADHGPDLVVLPF